MSQSEYTRANYYALVAARWGMLISQTMPSSNTRFLSSSDLK
jgi:hypothetical protein